MYNSDNEEMGHRVEETVLVQRGNNLQLKLKIDRGYSEKSLNVYETKKYQIRNSTEFQIQIKSYRQNDCNIIHTVFVRFVKLREDDHFTYMIKLTSEGLKIDGKTFATDDGTWHYIESKQDWSEWSADFNVCMDIVPSVHAFPTLYEDNDLTDFELRGEDGSVHLHKAVLAACSPVLKRMLSGSWREMSQGHIEVPGTSMATLQQLKNYMYLHTLPDSGLEQLLLLASCYMMPDLEQKCVDRLVNNMTADNAWDLFEFTVKNKLMNLLITLLESVDPDKVKDMRERFLKDLNKINE